MMRNPTFRYHAATSVADAAALLASEGPGAMLLAGGTDLIPNMKRRQQTPKLVIGLHRAAELHAAAPTRAGGMSIGAARTLSEIVGDAALRGRYPALFRAAAQVATPHLRNMGTLGGNLCLDTRCNYYNQNAEWRRAIDFCMKAPGPAGEAIPAAARNIERDTCWVAPGSPRCWAVSSTDTAPALIALGARVRLTSTLGTRDIALEELYADDGMTYLTKRPDEILTHVELPPAVENQRSTYWKLRRRGSFDFPVLSVAAAVTFGSDGVVATARVVFGAVASHPVLADTEALVGRPLTDEAIQAFADAASKLAKPLDNTDFALGWRKRVAHKYVVGALRELRGDDLAQLGLFARRAATLVPVAG
jgi:4-hydroxybenzoyl-CoA reductase subunit beta